MTRLSAERPEDIELAIDAARQAARNMVVHGVRASTVFHNIIDGVERIGSLSGPPFIEFSEHTTGQDELYRKKPGNKVTTVIAETETRDADGSFHKQRAVYTHGKTPKGRIYALTTDDKLAVTPGSSGDSGETDFIFSEESSRDPKEARRVILAAHKEIVRRTRGKSRKK